MLSPTQIKAREGKLTASRVAALVNGDLRRLYLEMIGEQAEEDLTTVWPVQLGAVTETLNLDWYDWKHNQVTRRGEVVVHPSLTWAACTLDGWDTVLNCPIECKHTGGREPVEILHQRYAPQLAWQMLCTGATQCAFSVIMGADEPIVDYIERDIEFQRDLVDRGRWFMECVRTRTPPYDMTPIASPLPADLLIDMTGNNNWASEAVEWLETRHAASRNEEAKANLKRLVPDEARRAEGHGVVITRNRAGNLSLREFSK